MFLGIRLVADSLRPLQQTIQFKMFRENAANFFAKARDVFFPTPRADDASQPGSMMAPTDSINLSTVSDTDSSEQSVASIPESTKPGDTITGKLRI